MARQKKTKKSQKGSLAIGMNRARTLAILGLWVFALGFVLYAFLSKFLGFEETLEKSLVRNLEEALGPYAFLIAGVLLALLMAWFIFDLVHQLRYQGALYKVNEKGLTLNRADRLFVPRENILSIFFTYNHGMPVFAILEVNDPDLLKDLSEKGRLPGLSCNPERRTISISLTGLRAKKKFVTALKKLAAPGVPGQKRQVA